ncbi:MAG: DUF934 domain-containing protein [Notoacmeibacter sp.]|nr:DUF934 domain-containing protein [Notoacmeibacter sp.]
MTDGTTEPRLWTRTGFATDRWIRAESLDGAADDAQILLPLEAFLVLDAAALETRAGRIGVELQPGDPIEAITDRLDELALVALAFPGFADGRSYSKAHLLRTRCGYAGTIRATGEVLTDQLAHMLRTGFDELVVSDPVAQARLSAGQTGGLGYHYQPAANPAPSPRSYSWRRVSARSSEENPRIHHN